MVSNISQSKGQISTEYILILTAVLLLALVTTIVYYTLINKSSTGRLSVELLGAGRPASNVIAISTNLVINESVDSGGIFINNINYPIKILPTFYNTSTGIEYEFGNDSSLNTLTTISSITYNTTNGKEVVILPIGTDKINITRNSTFPFHIS